MRSKTMRFCTGLAGSFMLSCLLSDTSLGQQTLQNPPIELQFNPDTTSRRAPLDLFNLKRPQPPQPHYTTTNQPAPKPTPQPTPLETPVELRAGLASEAEAWDAVDLLNSQRLQEPQDPPTTQEAEVDASQEDLDDLDSPETDDEEAVTNAYGDLNPDQSRPLSVNVGAVNITTIEIGTGVLPEGASRTEATSRMLPTGLEREARFVCAHWQPSLVTHYPLYFEDAMLERHGHVRWGHLQSFASGVKFFSTLPMLPYLRTLRPKHDCIYQVGHYRAGSCAPVLKDHLPYDKHAAVVEGLSLAGFFWAMPL